LESNPIVSGRHVAWGRRRSMPSVGAMQKPCFSLWMTVPVDGWINEYVANCVKCQC
jgi:hypothetical protein